MKSRSRHPDLLSVCICTYKRPDLLKRLLEGLQHQRRADLFEFEIVVADNDASESARDIVAEMRDDSRVPIKYLVEPEQNIALARNKVLGNAEGRYLAGIDDDEYPDESWLLSLYNTASMFKADGVLGPVLPSFQVEPPRWIERGRMFVRESFPTGTVLKNPRHTRTGNFMISRRIIDETGELFNPLYGKTGGEDVDFFGRMIARDFVFVWCDEAKVYETIPPQRLKRSFFLRRALLRGVAVSKQASLVSLDTLKSLSAAFLYTLLLPFLALYRHDAFMKFLIKDCDHIGKILARCGIKPVRERWE